MTIIDIIYTVIKMKHMKKLIFTIIFALCLFGTSCTEGVPSNPNGDDKPITEIVILETPTNVTVEEKNDSFIVKFDEVENAYQYEFRLYKNTESALVAKVVVDAKEANGVFDVKNLNNGKKLIAGNYYVSVKAIAESESNFVSSNVSEKVFFQVFQDEANCTVSFNSNGGSYVLDQSITKGTKAVKPSDPTKDGYVFDGWYLNDTLFNFNTNVVTDIVLVAKWRESGQTTEKELIDYYKSILNSDGSLPVGNALKTSLRTLITNTHKKITTYNDCKTYLQTADEDPNNSNNMLLFYTGESVPKSDDMNVWNREHVWPQSLGWFKTSGAGADLHHIRPCNPSVNSSRGNKKFGETSSFYIPTDNYKGDVARIIFYLMTRYSDADSYSFTSVCQSVEILLKWNRLDKPDEHEEHRNEYIAKIQGNRNPFIDYPEFADMIWG